MADRPLKVVITGGGTGGHLFPAVAVAQEILCRCPDAEILFVGTGRHLDREAMDQYGFTIRTIHCGGLKGGSLLNKLATIIKLPFSLLEAMVIISRFKPRLVFGVGGYVTGPVILGAKLLGIKACIHEQNSVPGMANRRLGPMVDRIFLSIPGSEKYFPADRCRLLGNPVRREIMEIALRAKRSGKDSVLLVLGGSQGAHAINLLVPEALSSRVLDLPAGFRVIHQTGTQDEEMVKEAYVKAGIKARVAAFFKEMPEIYSEAALVVARAGATTLAELTLLKKAAILIPFPYAADVGIPAEHDRVLPVGGQHFRAKFLLLDYQCQTSH